MASFSSDALSADRSLTTPKKASRPFQATGGIAFTAGSPEDIYAAFVRVFEQTDQPLIADIQNGAIDVDPEVKSLRLLVRREAGAGPVLLTDPSNNRITAQDQRGDLDWQSTPGYDQITIQDPQTGAWQVSSTGSEHKAYIESDLDLAVDLPRRAAVGAPIPIRARLNRQDAPWSAEQLQALRMQARVNQESGAAVGVVPLALIPEDPSAATFAGEVRLAQAGTYSIEIQAEHPDFRRSRLGFVSVQNAEPPASPQQPTVPPPAGSPPAGPAPLDPADPANAADIQARSTAARTLLFANLALVAAAGIGFLVWRWRKGRQAPQATDGGVGNDVP